MGRGRASHSRCRCTPAVQLGQPGVAGPLGGLRPRGGAGADGAAAGRVGRHAQACCGCSCGRRGLAHQAGGWCWSALVLVWNQRCSRLLQPLHNVKIVFPVVQTRFLSVPFA